MNIRAVPRRSAPWSAIPPLRRLVASLLCVGSIAFFHSAIAASSTPAGLSTDELARCNALLLNDALTIIYADIRTTPDGKTRYCYAKGLIQGRITYHVQLPLPSNWTGQLVHLGDGGADGDLDYSDTLLSRGVAVANSNTGHDVGAAGDAYGFQDEASLIDFAWRAVHLTTLASKTLVNIYYKKHEDHAYHVGCSTGGRQALVAAQLFPEDFDGIVAGAPAIHQLPRMTHRVLLERTLMANGFAANLAFDSDHDGMPDSLRKIELIAQRVTAQCDSADGVSDGVIEPDLCRFDVDRDLAALRCRDDVDGESCLTRAQMSALHQIYEGTRDSKGQIIYPGGPLGSEFSWADIIIPNQKNKGAPYFLTSGAPVVAYTLYEHDPGVLPPNFGKPDDPLDKTAALPEWGWWEANADDVETAGANTPTRRALNGNDPDLHRFFASGKRRLLLYQGLADAIIPPLPVIDYNNAVIKTTFANDLTKAQENVRLFLAPGMGHCSGGPGPNTVDWFAPLAQWVEKGIAPDRVIATHLSNGHVDNERPLCVYPKRAVFVGATERADLSSNEYSANDPSQWVAKNFECK